MHLLQRAFQTVSNRSRQRKLKLFFRLMAPTPHSRVLDLGGEAPAPRQPHKQLVQLYPYANRLVLTNLEYPLVKRAAQAMPVVHAVCGDGLRLPYADQAFDVCYCNAVIEHLFTWENQQRFAAEIMRVARSWFVTTPNRWFPFEPHMRLPLVSWLPQPWLHAIGFKISYSHLKGKYVRRKDWSELRLLGRPQLRRLFPGSIIFRNGVIGFTPTYIVAGGEALAARKRSC